MACFDVCGLVVATQRCDLAPATAHPVAVSTVGRSSFWVCGGVCVCTLQRLGLASTAHRVDVVVGAVVALAGPSLAVAAGVVVGVCCGVGHRPMGLDASRILVELCGGGGVVCVGP